MAGCNVSPHKVEKMLRDAGFTAVRSNKHTTWTYEDTDVKGHSVVFMTEVPHGEIKGVKTWLSIKKAAEDAQAFKREKSQYRLLQKQKGFESAFKLRTQELKDLRERARTTVRNAIKAGVDIPAALQSQKLKLSHLNTGL